MTGYPVHNRGESRKPGRPPFAAKAPEVAREPARKPKAGEAVGRNGEILRRNRNYNDPFSLPEGFKEPGWSYQWCRHSCFGKEDRAEMLHMQDNGWRTVPNHRMGMDGKEDDGCIIRDGLILMERPAVLTEEAEAEEHAKAMQQWESSFKRVDSDVKGTTLGRTLRNMSRREGRVLAPDDVRPETKPALHQDIPQD